jgi:ubiquitin-conjugating enzyme E2 M
MIRLKQKKAEEKKAAEEKAAAAEAAPAPSEGKDATEPEKTGTATEGKMEVEADGSGGGSNGGLKLLGIGGKSTKSGEAKKSGKKKTPGEIRIQKDITDLDAGAVGQVVFPNPNDLTAFQVIVSPDSGFWLGAKYEFMFTIPALYPHEPPKVVCKTKIYHPNINLEGAVCLNILREDWKPVLDINAVIYGLIYLFYEPNPDDPLNREAADLFRNDRQQVRQFHVQ